MKVVGGGSEGYFLQLRVGDQMMRIPFGVELGGKQAGSAPDIPSLGAPFPLSFRSACLLT